VYLMGEALVAGEQFDEAIAHSREALRVNPEHASAHNNLGAALAQLGREAEAIPHLRKAVEYKGDDADARNNLGIALAVTGNLGAAVPHLEEAVRLTGGRDPMMLDVLGRIYAAAGRREDAARAAHRAADAAKARGDGRMADALAERARMYESRQVR
jgi:Flp pilus assembly protein TadD